MILKFSKEVYFFRFFSKIHTYKCLHLHLKLLLKTGKFTENSLNLIFVLSKVFSLNLLLTIKFLSKFLPVLS